MMIGPKFLTLTRAGIALSALLLPAALALAAQSKPAAKPALAAAEPVDFDRDVRPILADNCLTCHGFDANTRQAGLRLDTAEGAYQKLPSGAFAIVPGKPKQSTFIHRIDSGSMPPASSGKKLTPAQIETLRKWVAQGAKYEAHWAFVPPQRPAVPDVRYQQWALNPIDRFVLARLEREGLKPSPAADRRALIRRLALDLTGLPPTLSEVDAFLADRSPNAYEKVVDRLLASPHYGERMALKWLDLARYADTHGYHIDSHRDMWRWRDWVIDAFNQNKSFDQFTLEQLAGDMLPNATLQQKIATGFNRNHPINFEGGAIPEEYHAAYIFDRIDTTATTWMGLTLRCSQCHDHKYEPLTQKDFYRFYAFFHNVPENGLDGRTGNAAPFIKAPLPWHTEKLAEYDRQIGSLEQAARERATETAAAQAAWEKTVDVSTLSPVTEGLVAHFGLDERSGAQLRNIAAGQAAGTLRGGEGAWAAGKFGGALDLNGQVYADLGAGITLERTDKFSYGAWVHPTDNGQMTVLSRMDDAANHRGWDLYLGGGKVFVHLIHQWEGNAIRVNTKKPIPLNQWTHVFATYDGSSKAAGVKIYVNGKAVELDLTHDKLSGSIVAKTPVHIGRRGPGAPFKGKIDEVRIYGRELSASEVERLAGFEALRQILTTAADQRTDEQKAALSRFYLETFDAPYHRISTELTAARTKRTELDNSIPTTMVMQEMEKPRDTFILVRGEYNKKGEKVTPGIPGALPQLSDYPPNRLGLAQWLVHPQHPLTARVAVNRFWQMYFGHGIVRTPENFGVQGERPTHPELLDWLATEFIRSGWDVKALQRLIVTSNTYKQASRVSPELLAKDPDNMLLARGPRFRLPAEFVRDQALAVAGLLVPKIGGPSVKPYHPPGLWEEIAFGGNFTAQKYEQDHGEALWRRSMYTFWKRTCPPPSLQTFDAPEREFCVVQRSATNTPLQALVLMNDTQFVEASRKFAERIMSEVAATPRDRIHYAFRLALARPATGIELRALLEVYEAQLAEYRKDREAAKKLVSVGEAPRNESLDVAELAAWTSVANAIFNLDEMITKN